MGFARYNRDLKVMKNQMEKKMEHAMQAGFRVSGLGLPQYIGSKIL